MQVRLAWENDLETIKDIHRRAGYGFKMPEGGLLGCHIVEEDGKVIAAAGYEPCAQIVAVIEPEVTEPQRRLNAIGLLHEPLARIFLRSEMRDAYAFVDPLYRNFGHRLMRMGWSKKMWDCYFISHNDMAKLLEQERQCA